MKKRNNSFSHATHESNYLQCWFSVMLSFLLSGNIAKETSFVYKAQTINWSTISVTFDFSVGVEEEVTSGLESYKDKYIRSREKNLRKIQGLVTSIKNLGDH
jgi:hypothetical protein